MRVLVTGIEGFVGSHTAEYLLGVPDVEVHGTVLDMGLTKNIDGIRSSLNLHEIDVLNAQRVEALCDQIRPNRILHLAGQAFVPTSLKDPLGTFQTNVFGGLTILEAVRKMRGRGSVDPAVTIVSTGEVYGNVDRKNQPIDENTPLRPNNPYAASKASLDLIAQQYHNSFGVNVTVARPFNHFGPRQSPVFVCSDFGRQFAEIAAGKRLPEIHVGNIETRRDFTDVRDVVRAYWALFERASTEAVFNVCSGKGIRIRDILSMFEEISGRKVAIVSESGRVRPYDVPIVVGSFERLRAATGWGPRIPMMQTLRDVFEYWMAEVA
jgi:GDP-4-dehydro-6-deoxy-D-mannose reductase